VRLAVPLAVHVALCLLHIWFVADSPLLRYLTLDLQSYDTWARAILAGDVWGGQVFYQDPLYPYLMALVYKLTGARVVHVLLVQVAASATSVYLTWRLADTLFGSRAALVALWAAALYGPAVYYAGKPEKAAFAALAVTAALWMVVRAREGRPRHWLAAGALFGVGSLLRGNVLFVAAAAAVLAALTPLAISGGWGRRLRSAALLAAGLALVLLPVLLRNRVVGEEWVFTTSQAGANLFIGNNAGNVTGTYAVPHFVRPSPLYEEEDFRRFAEHTVGRALGASEVSRFYVGQVVDWAWRDPARFLRLQGTKLLAFVDRWEYPDNWSLYFVRRFSPLLALPLLSYGVVVPFAALGLVAAFRRPRDPARVFFVLLVLAYAASVVAFYVFSRYRFPIVFALVALAAHGAVTLWQDLVERRWPRAALGAGVLIAAGAVSFFAKRNDEAGDLSQRYYNLSASFLRDRRVAEAEALARKAAEEGPRNHLPYLTLAEVASARGDTRAEGQALVQAFDRRPDDDDIRARLVRLRSRTDGYRPALALAGAWLAQRESYRLRQALVETTIEHEAWDDARGALAELLARYPEDAWGQEKRIALAIHERDWQAVIGAAEARLRRAPRETRWLKVLAVAYREAGETSAAERYARRAGLPWPLPAGATLDDPLARARPLAWTGPGEAARRLVAEKRYDEAIALLTEEIRRNGGDALTYQFLSNAYYEKGDLDAARAAVAEAARHDPANPLYKGNLEALDRRLRAEGARARSR
jgi:4-amino-4-deoxy-L-arabinose transferase-like glycosyltransferase/predicted Zn-dependent protease